jgi:uncharacterized protein
MKRWILIVVCLLAGLAHGTVQGTSPVVPAQPKAQEPASATAKEQHKIDPAKEADIRRLMDMVGIKKVMTDTMESMIQGLRPVLSNSLPPGDYREKLVDLFYAKFQSKADMTYLLDLAVPVYDKYFSHEEIKGLLAFYATPLGQKSISVMPQLTNEMRDAGRKWGEELGRTSMLEVLDEHPDLKTALEEAGKRAGQQ